MLQKLMAYKKMVLMKIFVAIILTKLQRFASRANVERQCYAAGPEIWSKADSTSRYLRSKLTSYSKSALNFSLKTRKVFRKPATFFPIFCGLETLRHK